MRDVHRALAREIGRRHPELTLLSSGSEPWASVTFTGERHRYAFGPGPLPLDLPEAEFVLPGHVVADLTVASTPEGICIEALTIEAN